MNVKATIINARKIISKKYNISLKDLDLEYVDEFTNTDDDGNHWWSMIYTASGRFFKFHGMNDNMDDDCHEQFKKIEMKEVVTWSDDDTI